MAAHELRRIVPRARPEGRGFRETQTARFESMAIEKVIVLEDEPIVRKSLETFLRRKRYDVASAGSLAQAQEYLDKDNFDIMFLDVRLPDGDGRELLKSLQSRPQRPLAVVTTGFASV